MRTQEISYVKRPHSSFTPVLIVNVLLFNYGQSLSCQFGVLKDRF